MNETYDAATDPAADVHLPEEDGGCTCPAVEPDYQLVGWDCPIHEHLLLEEAAS